MFLQYLFQIAVPLISKCHTLLTQGKACLAFQRCRDTSRKLDMSSRAGIGNRWWTGDPKRSGQASLFLFHQSLVYSWVSAHLTVYVKGSQVYILPFLRSENEAGCNIPCLRPLWCATTLRSADVVLVLRSDSNVDAVTHQPTNTHSKASQHANKVALCMEWTHSRPDRRDSLFGSWVKFIVRMME